MRICGVRPWAGELALPRNWPGLSELLAEEVKLRECVIYGDPENLDVISTGYIPPDPLRLLFSVRLPNALKVLREKYDRIIVDSPPILRVSDAAVLSSHVDSVVFVVKADATSVDQIQNGLEQLRRVEAPVAGVVVNQLDKDKARKYGDVEYRRYEECYVPNPTVVA